MAKLSQVVVVGRMNVGKSTLFNRLAHKAKSIAFDYAGVTRDFVRDEVFWQGVSFELIDSGGISLKKMHDPIAEKVRTLALKLVEQADLILFMCDGTLEPTLDDIELARYLRKMNKPVVLVINKVDEQYHAYETMSAYARLGFEYIIHVSALHGKGIAELLDSIVELAPKKSEDYQEEEQKFSVVFLGKPNVGKSSLMNLLLDDERMIVADMPGTTREPVSEKIKFYQETVVLTDTPGIRRKRSIEEPLEKIMVRTAFSALDRADVVALLIDGAAGTISDQELKLAFYAFEQGKGLILLINKTDLVNEEIKADFLDEASRYTYFLSKIPQLSISCVTKKNIGKVMPLIAQVWQRAQQEFSDIELTMCFKEALKRTPLFHNKRPLMVRRAEQVGKNPLKIVLTVNEPDWFGPSQLAFFENVMRKEYDLKGVPVVLVMRKNK